MLNTKIFFCIITFLFVVSFSFAFDAQGDDKHFSFMRKFAGKIQLAFKTFQKDGVEITVIAVSHYAQKDFFTEASSAIDNKAVLYELQYATADMIKDLQNSYTSLSEKSAARYIYLSKNLGTIYSYMSLASDSSCLNKIIFLSVGATCDQFRGLSYEKACELIHADYPPDEFTKVNFHNTLKNSEQLLMNRVLFPLNKFPVALLNICELLLEYAGVPLLSKTASFIGLRQLFEDTSLKFHKNICDDVVEDEFKRQVEDIKNINQIVFSKLEEILQNNEHSKLCILYGYNHCPDFQKYLEDTGFELVLVNWVSAY